MHKRRTQDGLPQIANVASPEHQFSLIISLRKENGGVDEPMNVTVFQWS